MRGHEKSGKISRVKRLREEEEEKIEMMNRHGNTGMKTVRVV